MTDQDKFRIKSAYMSLPGVRNVRVEKVKYYQVTVNTYPSIDREERFDIYRREEAVEKMFPEHRFEFKVHLD